MNKNLFLKYNNTVLSFQTCIAFSLCSYTCSAYKRCKC